MRVCVRFNGYRAPIGFYGQPAFVFPVHRHQAGFGGGFYRVPHRSFYSSGFGRGFGHPGFGPGLGHPGLGHPGFGRGGINIGFGF